MMIEQSSHTLKNCVGKQYDEDIISMSCAWCNKDTDVYYERAHSSKRVRIECSIKYNRCSPPTDMKVTFCHSKCFLRWIARTCIRSRCLRCRDVDEPPFRWRVYNNGVCVSLKGVTICDRCLPSYKYGIVLEQDEAMKIFDKIMEELHVTIEDDLIKFEGRCIASDEDDSSDEE